MMPSLKMLNFYILQEEGPISGKELKALNKRHSKLGHLIENYQTSSLLARFRANMRITT